MCLCPYKIQGYILPISVVAFSKTVWVNVSKSVICPQCWSTLMFSSLYNLQVISQHSVCQSLCKVKQCQHWTAGGFILTSHIMREVLQVLTKQDVDEWGLAAQKALPIDFSCVWEGCYWVALAPSLCVVWMETIQLNLEGLDVTMLVCQHISKSIWCITMKSGENTDAS